MARKPVRHGAGRVQDWLEDQTQPRPAWQDREDASVHALEILPDGTVLRHEAQGSYPMGRTQAALGSGAPYALTAMVCGRTAAEAVNIAALFDVWTGGGADVLALAPGADPAA